MILWFLDFCLYNKCNNLVESIGKFYTRITNIFFTATNSILHTYPGSLTVRLVVEVSEEEEEHNSMHADPPDESARVVALNE